MKTNVLLIAAMVSLVFFGGCKKENTSNWDTIEKDNSNRLRSAVEKNNQAIQKNDFSESMLTFHTANELFSYMSNAKENNSKRGFSSFARKTEEVYYSIKPEEMFHDMEEVIQFVKKHSDIFQLILYYDGDYIVETRMYDHPYRNVANEDGLFQVGDTIYKIIDGGLAYTSIDKKNDLEHISNNSVYNNTDSIKYYMFCEHLKDDSSELRRPHYCEEEELHNENTIGNNRITLRINNVLDGPFNTNYYKHGYEYIAKPYHKSVGWWGCYRTITANVNQMLIGTGGIVTITEELPTVSNLVHYGNKLEFSHFSENYEYMNSFAVYSCDCTASTPDAGTVAVICQ